MSSSDDHINVLTRASTGCADDRTDRIILMKEVYVTETRHLEALCDDWSNEAWLGVDTEFLRVRTYYPRLCLLQVATPQQIALIDPVAELSLRPLCRLFADPRIVKILHAARQDLEVLYPLCSAPPAAVFDTQIAAGLLGFGDQVGYAALVAELVGVQLAKGHTRSDWCKRPLPSEQLAYAVDDVRFLGGLHQKLVEKLKSAGREDWCRQECDRLVAPDLYSQDPTAAFERARIGASLPPEAQPLLQDLVTWREHAAQQRDLPRNWIATDRQLADIAICQPATEAALAKVDGITTRFVQRNGGEVVAILKSFADRPTSKVIWDTYPPLSNSQRRLCDRLMAMARDAAESSSIATALLATRRDVEALVRGNTDIPLLTGWRRDLVGERLKTYINDHSSTTSTVSS